MARARRRATSPADYPTPPPELAGRCWVEDWLSAQEVAAHGFTASCPACPQASRAPRDSRVPCPATLLLIARRRWRDERETWLAEHAVPRILQCRLVPLRRPVFRDD